MEAKKIGDITVNDGKGLLDNDGLMETLIVDCNSLVKILINGNYVAFCNALVQIVAKIDLLRKNWKTEMTAKDVRIKDLQEMNHNLLERVTGLPDEYEGSGKDC